MGLMGDFGENTTLAVAIAWFQGVFFATAACICGWAGSITAVMQQGAAHRPESYAAWNGRAIHA